MMARGDPASGRMKSATRSLKGQPGPVVRGQGGGASPPPMSPQSSGNVASCQPVRASLQLSPLEAGEHLPGRPWQDDAPLWGEGLEESRSPVWISKERHIINEQQDKASKN